MPHPSFWRRTIARWAYALIGLLLVTGCAAASPPAAGIAVRPAEYDFGEIAADEIAVATLQVLNTGTLPLRIADVRTSCGCTQASLGQDTLAPGEETALSIRFDPQAHPGLYGPLLRLIYLQSDDPVAPELEIPIHVTILAPQDTP